MSNKKKMYLVSMCIMITIIILGNLVEIHTTINSVDLYSGKVLRQKYICGIRVKNEYVETRFSDLITQYNMKSEHVPDWFQDSKVVLKGLGVIKTGGRIQAACNEFATIITLINIDDHTKKEYIAKALLNLQNNNIDELIQLSIILSSK